MKKVMLFVAVLVIITVLLTSCSFVSKESDSAQQGSGIAYRRNLDEILDMGPVKGGSLKLFSTTPDTLNPVLSCNASVHEFSALIFESLVKLDRNMKPVPVLAENWEISDDGLTWTFHIRKDVQWHDRMRLSAEDVEFTMSVILDSKIDSVYKDNLKNVSSFTVLDQDTIKIVLKSPYSFLAEMMTFPILPRHYFYGHSVSDMKSDRNMNPIGTGPYKFVYSDDNVIRLAINDNWWAANDEDDAELSHPYITGIEIKIFDSRLDSMNAFQNRDIDLITTDAYYCSRFAGRSDIIIKRYPGRNYEFLAFNLSKPVMEDPSVRKAIALAINRQEIIEQAVLGEATAADMPVIPGTWIYDANMANKIKPDAQKAKQLLLDNGWYESRGVLYKNIEGIRTPLNLEILVNEDNAKRIKVAEEISKQISEAGINIKIKKAKWEEEMKLISEKKFDIVLTGCRVPMVPDISFMFQSQEIVDGLNIAGYSNPTVDNYLNKILAEKDDIKKKAYFMNLRNLIDEELPYLGLFFYNEATIFNKKIRGELNPFINNMLYGFEKWYLLAE